ncbi:hypothetical protein, partial [Modicisalibacter zincidurans]|uniref:hypothetical protein n=1 Tax=Modicisalibacter zincidurans TaxID=1178777 RepID=UPI0031ECAEE8
TATGAKRDVGHGTVWVNDDIRYIAMQVSRLEALQGGSVSRIQDFVMFHGYLPTASWKIAIRFKAGGSYA